jgi:hypothetical protein
MHIHNGKVIYITSSILIFLFAVNYINKNSDEIHIANNISYGNPIATTTSKPLIPVTTINKNSKSSQIQSTIFTPRQSSTLNINKDNDYLSTYLINIFCSESTKKYVKVASGSGVFLSSPDETKSVILTNAHVARHLLDSNKKCVGRTGSPTSTTHTLVLRYIPSYWLNIHNQYVIGDPDQKSTGEYDFAILEATRIKPIKNNYNIYTALKTGPKLKISNYDDKNYLNSVHIYSYPAQAILTKNVNSSLYQKKDTVTVSTVYANPKENIQESLLDVVGSKYVDHGSSGGMVISQGLTNSIIGLSSVLIKSNEPQTVRVVTMKHVLYTIQSDLEKINNAQTDPFLYIIKDLLVNKEIDMSFVQIFKNIKLTSVLEQYTRDTLRNLNIIK